VQRINLQDTLNAVIHLIQTSKVTVEKNLKVVTNYDPCLPEFIHSDSRRIQQILYNLLGNAIKFSKEEGTIEFGVDIIEDNRTIRFSVKDFGKGIEEVDFGKIFEPFRQTETGLTNATGGTGLGLAITKKLVDAMGGKISVESEYGSWTNFIADFPFKNKDRRVDAQFLSSKLARTAVLFVADDQDPNTQRVQAMLDHFEVTCFQFNNMKDLNQALNLRAAPAFDSLRDAYVCLSHEDLCDIGSYELLAAKAPTCLATFGPKFSIERITKKHWRSLVETFPSVLVHKLGRFAEELLNKNKQISSNGVSQTKAGWEHLRILIAEDNLVNQKVLTRILNRLGIHSIKIANNGVEAIEKEAKEAFDLVLMDMQMPKMDGIEACQAIKKRVPKDGEHEVAKVIFVTAHVSNSFRQSCLEKGAIGYLPKPLSLDGVKGVLQHAIGSGSLYSPGYNDSWNKFTTPPIMQMEASNRSDNFSGSNRSDTSSWNKFTTPPIMEMEASNRSDNFSGSNRSDTSRNRSRMSWFDWSKQSQN
jgi:CheY-like chemotaxis protein/anti-sigma regulatory factor (Ser/Thr protein kinase)